MALSLCQTFLLFTINYHWFEPVNVTLPDTSTVAVSYDETSNEIDAGSTTYAIGESFVSGGLKVTPKEI